MNKAYNFALLIISLICFAVVSGCLFGMFFIETSVDSPPSRLSLLCGLGFWLCNIVGIVLQVIVSKNVKHWYERRRLFRTRFRRNRIGLFNVFSNIPAAISDVLLCVSMIAYISLSVLFLSFSAHCIFNGKNYYYILNYEYIRTQLMKSEEK